MTGYDDQLINRVTEEVVKRLQALNPGSGGGAAGVEATVPNRKTLGMTSAELASYIDHTLLKPEAEQAQIEKLCDEAVENRFFAVCVNSRWTEFCARRLRGTGVKVAAVVGFPLGAMATRIKAMEARHAGEQGADEIDMVISIGSLKARQLEDARKDIVAVMRSTRPNVLTKVIIETVLLTEEEKILACQVVKDSGAEYIKTSTGFAGGGATVEDVALMRRLVGPNVGVKAAGGVRSLADAKAMIEAGATRIGTSSGVKIIRGDAVSGGY